MNKLGEATQKRQRHSKVLQAAKGCIYCAGRRPAEQIDHMPPRMMFRLSQRPKGLEFPSCGPCNQGTSRVDVVASFMARTFPGIADSAEDEEWARLMNEVKRVAPDLLREMWMSPQEMRLVMLREGIFDQNLAAFRADGPILGAHMQTFAAKIGFALHYEATGDFVPSEGRVQVRWFTSSEVYGGRLPPSLLASIGEPRIMRQGKITSRGDFEYGWGYYSERPDVPIYYARIRDAFAVAAFVALNEGLLPFPEGELATFAPGDLVMSPTDRITASHP